MATNAYLDRMDQLKTQKYQDLQSQVSLPLQRPLNKQQPGYAISTPPKEETPNFDTPFGSNFKRFTEEDDRFGQMFGEFQRMAQGMKHMVAQGLMPEPIAQEKLAQFLTDSRNHFARNPKQPLDDPNAKQALMGALQGVVQDAQQQAPQPVSAPQGPDQEQAPEQQEAQPQIQGGA